VPRAPRFGPYRILERIARSPEGAVDRAYEADGNLAEVLVVSTPDTGATAGWTERVTRLRPDLVITTGADGVRRWEVLPLDQTQAAVELIGLDAPPARHPLAVAWGWPHPYPRTARQLLVRIVTTIVGAVVLAWAFQLVVALIR
jgi:hypothetical protein